MTADLFSVSGAAVVVTGGLGQLGRAISIALVDLGARVAVLDVAAEGSAPAERFGERARDPSLCFIAADVADRSSLENAAESIDALWGVPTALINCAALDSPPNAPAEENGPFETYPEGSWDRVLEVNLKGAFLCCQTFGARMAEQGRGSVVNISSIYGVVSPNQTIYDYRRARGETFYKPVAYAASKSGLLNLTRYLSTYWAPRNVRVNTLTLAGLFNDQEEAFLRSYTPHVPLGRMATEQDYLGAVVFLVSGASAYMTGANLVVDGGWTAW